MIWESWSAFWSMGGRGFFVWGSYGALLIAVIAELIALKRARKRALACAEDSHDA
ncbi:MAG: heme exporter protein CcmD [Burkholderiales bacterium]|nr:MAG: heme exporter protein CcmD [Burkholderiales bacterium]TAG83208.1 MAG: heme exporter protein CcmD [Betaproteobacteria bacterium]